MNNPYLRIQKARSGKYIQFVFVYFDKDEKKQMYFSVSYAALQSYLNNTTNIKFLTCPMMFGKDTEQYKAFIKEKKIMDKLKKMPQNGEIGSKNPAETI